MFRKKFNVIAIVIIIFIGLFITSAAVNSVETTKFTTDFMEGSFVGNVELNGDYECSSYVDSKNGITYNLSTVDDTNPVIDIYKNQGLSDPTKVTLNGNDWNIYFVDAVPTGEDNKNEVMNVIICQSQKEKQGYLIYVIIDSKSDYIQPSMDTSSEAYILYVEPLLQSINLKESDNVPNVYDELAQA